MFFSLVGVMLQLGPFSWEFDVYWEEFPAKRCHEKCYTVLPTYSELEPVNAQWGLLFYHSHMYRFFMPLHLHEIFVICLSFLKNKSLENAHTLENFRGVCTVVIICTNRNLIGKKLETSRCNLFIFEYFKFPTKFDK